MMRDPSSWTRRLTRWLIERLGLGRRSDDAASDVIELFVSRRHDRGRLYATWRFLGDVWSLAARPRHLSAATATAWRAATWRTDLVHGARWLRRSREVTIPAVVSLTLAIGVGTAVSSVLNGTHLRAYLSADPALAFAWREHATGASRVWRLDELLDIRQRARLMSLEAAAPVRLPVETTAVTSHSNPALVTFVTDRYLMAFAPAAAVGRLLGPDDNRQGAPPTAVVSHLFWRRTLDGDRSVVGRRIRVAGVSVQVVGVAARDFVDPSGGEPVAWMPVSHVDRLDAAAGGSGSGRRVSAIGRLRTDATVSAATAELTRLAVETPARGGDPAATGVSLQPVTPSEETALHRRIVIVVVAVVALVLLLACANVSNLLLAAGTTREREIGVRLALGASPGRIVRQVLFESLIVAFAGTAAGAVLGTWLAPPLAALAGLDSADIALDERMFGFLAASGILIAAGAAIAPARHAIRDARACLLAGGPATTGTARTGRARSTLVAVQSAASAVLLILAALLSRALVQVTQRDPGFDVDRLVYVSANLAGGRLTPADQGRAREFWTAAAERARSLPGVEAASLSQYPPFGVSFGDSNQLRIDQTDADVFATLGLRLVRGRVYTSDEVAHRAPIAVVNQTAVRVYWGTDDPVGRALGPTLGGRTLAGSRVVGVVGDTMVQDLSLATPVVFVPGVFYPRTLLAVRASDPRAVAEPLRSSIQALAPGIRPQLVVVADRIGPRYDGPRRNAALAATVALFALFLAAFGLFSVTTFTVGQRRREIGIRMAIGATTAHIRRDVVIESLRPLMVGLVTGLGLAALTSRTLEGVLYGISARDPLSFAVAVSVLVAAGVVAAGLPTRRAVSVDPAVVLRDA